ncbi:MAG TPA: site-specific tyrosine recombinase XerC [Dongiaceae bacterium]|nr:site-specific tyrosine recombinase XerC [Dongiaceae bacterium]
MRTYYAHLAEQDLSRHKPSEHEDPQGLLYLVARYLEHLRVHHFSPQTVYTRSKVLRPFRSFCEQAGLTQARQVTRAVIFNYQSYLYHYRKKDGEPLAVETQNHALSIVAGFFGWLTKQSLLLYNPASDLEYGRTSRRLPHALLSPAEIESVLNVPDLAKPTGLRNRAVLEVLYSTGMRRAELCQLNKGDVDFDRGFVWIEQGKGGKDRVVPIGERALQWLEKYLLEARPLLCSAVSEPAVFINTKGVRVNPNRIGSQVRYIFRAAGITRRGSCHLFRHTMATQLLEAGCDIRYIQAMLGHSSLESTRVYTHVTIAHLKAVHERFHPAKMPKQDAAAQPAAPKAQAEFAFIAPGGAGTIPAPGNGSANAPEATPDAATPAPVADLAARAELLAALEAEAAEES